MTAPEFFQHEKALVAAGAIIGAGTRIWAFTNIQDGAVVGERCNVCDGCFVEQGAKVGNFVTLKNGVAVFEGITIEDDVFVGANAAFINDRHPRSHRQKNWVLERTLVKKGATIGANATIMCGIVIGQYAVVGAGSVVVKNVPDHAIVLGNPAEFKAYACQCGQKLPPTLHCPCGLTYALNSEGLKIHA